MYKLNKILVLVLFSFFCSQNIQSQFVISGEFRPKAMLMDGYRELRNDTKFPYGIVIQRSRLNFDYAKDNISIGFSLQDIRVWGQDASTANNNSVGVHEAWLKYAFCKDLAIKLGRQTLKYDDERLLSTINWRDQNAVHDIAILQFNNEKNVLKADFGMALNNPAGYQNFLTEYAVSNYKYMSFLWLNKRFFDKSLETSLLGIADVYQTPSTIKNYKTRYTVGPYVNYKKGNLSLNSSFYYQTGKLANNKDVDAVFYSAKAMYKVHKSLELGAGFDHYSGTDFSDTTKAKTKSTTFDKLYGSGHTFLGYMDYFSGNSSDITKGAGINDIYFKANLIFNEKHSLEATYHIFSLDKPYFLQAKKASIKYDKALGSELDLLYSYKPNKIINFNLGYSVYLPSETMENIHGFAKGDSKFAQFAYLMLTIKPVFLNYTEK